MKNKIIVLLMLFCSVLYGQHQTERVLFIGNSYTYVNDLPKMIADIAESTGDTLIHKSSAPPGYTLKNHSSNGATLSKIKESNWNYVVLQEQSRLPSLQIEQLRKNVFPYAQDLNRIIKTYNPCSETIFFMTWGRKNGDSSGCASWPPVCTYEGMDSLLNLRYRMMADRNEALIAPVGAVWHYIRHNYPSINLYLEDGSHPSVAGSYAAACTFYTILFKKDPLNIPFNSALSSADASKIKSCVKLIVFERLIEWNVGVYKPAAGFTCHNSGSKKIIYKNNSRSATEYKWDFGDGNTSSDSNPTHKYASSGSYRVELIASKCGLRDTVVQDIYVK